MTHDNETGADEFEVTLQLIGRIERLQVQTRSLKVGERPRSGYDPSPIRTVPALRLDSGGVTGIDDGDIADVHHRDHPESKYRGENGISVGFTSHYVAMRSRYPHIDDGIAGENILVAASQPLDPEDVAAGLVIAAADGEIWLREIVPAPPCVEFAKFCNQYPLDAKADKTVAETVRFLSDGRRGYYATLEHAESTPIVVGDPVYRVVAS